MQWTSAMLTQDGQVMVERSDRMWYTGEGNGKPLWAVRHLYCHSCFKVASSAYLQCRQPPPVLGIIAHMSVALSCPALLYETCGVDSSASEWLAWASLGPLSSPSVPRGSCTLVSVPEVRPLFWGSCPLASAPWAHPPCLGVPAHLFRLPPSLCTGGLCALALAPQACSLLPWLVRAAPAPARPLHWGLVWTCFCSLCLPSAPGLCALILCHCLHSLSWELFVLWAVPGVLCGNKRFLKSKTSYITRLAFVVILHRP